GRPPTPWAGGGRGPRAELEDVARVVQPHRSPRRGWAHRGAPDARPAGGAAARRNRGRPGEAGCAGRSRNGRAPGWPWRTGPRNLGPPRRGVVRVSVGHSSHLAGCVAVSCFVAVIS